MSVFFLYRIHSHCLSSPEAVWKSLGDTPLISLWQLTPDGVSLLEQWVLTLGVSCFLLEIAAFLGLGIIYLDPYGYRKFFLILLEKRIPADQEIHFEAKPWKQRTKQWARLGQVFARSDGSEFCLMPPDKMDDDWVVLCFNEDDRTLIGPCRSLTSSADSSAYGCVVWFHEEGISAGMDGSVIPGQVFCLGKDEGHLSRFKFGI